MNYKKLLNAIIIITAGISLINAVLTYKLIKKKQKDLESLLELNPDEFKNNNNKEYNDFIDSLNSQVQI